MLGLGWKDESRVLHVGGLGGLGEPLSTRPTSYDGETTTRLRIGKFWMGLLTLPSLFTYFRQEPRRTLDG